MKAARASASSKREERADRDSPDKKATTSESPVYAARGLTLDGLGNRALLSLLRSGRLQRKARVSQSGDPREHEADRVAEAVVSGQAPARPVHHALSTQVQRMPTEEQQLASALGLGVQPAPVSSSAALPSDQPDAFAADRVGPLFGGRNLDEHTRSLMESRFGESFSDVRIHTDHRAAETAHALQSRAFTVGEDIVFGEGQFTPETTEGQRLLAHELTHVVQQRQRVGAIAGEKDAERDAHEAAREIISGGTPTVRERAVPGTIQMQPEEEWGFSRPASMVHGTTVVVDYHPMAFMPDAELMRTEGTNWDSAKRIYRVLVSVVGRRMQWIPYSGAEKYARSRNLEVIITARNSFTGRTLTVTIGARKAPKQSAPPQPPSRSSDKPAMEPSEENPAGTKAQGSNQVTKVEQQSKADPKGALKEAGDLSHKDLTSLGPAPRKSLLTAAADASPGSNAPQLANDLITTTPDRDAGELSDALHADGDKMLNNLKRNETDPEARVALDEAVKNLDARRLDAPPQKTEHDIVELTPEMKKKLDEIGDLLKKIGRRPASSNEKMEDRPEWTTLKTKIEEDFQRQLRNLERDVARWNTEHNILGMQSDSASGIETAAREEAGKGLEAMRAAKTEEELSEAFKLARHALWRADQMMDAKRALDRFESSVRAWNETQSGWASFAAVPSHLLADVSSDRPNQIAAEARAEINRNLALLRDAKTREEMSRAATQLKQAIANANFALSLHQDEVYGGGERTIVGIKVVAVTSAAIVAPQYVIPGVLVGGGLSTARQGVQIAEGSRKDFSGMEVFDSGVYGGFAGGILGPLGPLATSGSGWAATAGTVSTVGLSGWGLYNAAGEFSQGHGATGAFDVATALLPLFGAKGISGKGLRFSRSARTGALILRLSMEGVGDVPGIGGRNPTVSLPNEPGITMVVDARGRPVLLANAENPTPVSTGVDPAAPQATARATGNWQTVTTGNKPFQPYNMPVIISFTDPVDAAFSENAPYQVGNLNQVSRVRTTGSGRQMISLDSIQLSPSQREAAKAILGQSMRGPLLQAWQQTSNAREQADMLLVQQLWNQGTPQSQAQARDIANAAYERHHSRFVNFIRSPRNQSLQQEFTDAGMVFLGKGGAPIYRLPDGTEARLTLEHTTRKFDDPTRAVDGTNLQFVLDDENSYFLEAIRKSGNW